VVDDLGGSSDAKGESLVAARSDVQIAISKESLEQISGLQLAIAAGFDEKRIDKALTAASLAAAKGMVKPVRAAAPRRTGRLRKAVWANPVMRDKPGAYVGIRAGGSRADTKGSYYRWIVTSGVRNVPYTISPNRTSGAKALNLGGGIIRNSVVRRSPIAGRPFVTEAVNKNLDTAVRLFSDALATIIQRGIPKRGGIRIPKPR
jgi:hypothetical protein